MWTALIRVGIQLLAGLGIGKAMDTFVKPKVPATYYPEPVYPGSNPMKIFWVILSFAVGIIVARWIGRKFKISLLK
jgi:uncharacterized protein YneF (UPF0154 family)